MSSTDGDTIGGAKDGAHVMDRRSLLGWLACVPALAVSAIHPVLGQAVSTAGPEARQWIARLPSGEGWLTHFREDLLPFWDTPEAWGEPRGDFPTFRCNDGKRFIAATPCPELAGAPVWIRENLDREFVRMKSRQTYLYGVAFHLTGDARMLALARDGVRFIRSQALERDSGSAISFWQAGKAGPPILQRTSQDLAYAQLGLAMYYYLTRDEEVLADILRLKEHLFHRYWNAPWDMLMWVVDGGGSGDETRKELVAQLDQINAYLLLLTPILPQPHRARWKKDLLKLAHVKIDMM